MTAGWQGVGVWVCALGVAAGALILSGLRLSEAIEFRRLPGASPLVAADPPEAAGPQAGAVPAEPVAWPALFGTPADDAPEAAPPVAASLPDLVLKGLVTSGTRKWAILAIDGEDRLLNEGDRIGDLAVVAIGDEGVEVEVGGEGHLVVFDDSAPVRSVEVEVELGQGAEAPAPVINNVRTQVASPTELRDIILRAEADRVARQDEVSR
jgi:hypothetical protein